MHSVKCLLMEAHRVHAWLDMWVPHQAADLNALLTASVQVILPVSIRSVEILVQDLVVLMLNVVLCFMYQTVSVLQVSQAIRSLCAFLCNVSTHRYS
jgi:hypothetical protein